MSDYYVGVDENGKAYLAHFGIKGMKWGVRRYQNPDGTLTEAGQKHYASSLSEKLNKTDQKTAEAITRRERAAYNLMKTEQKLKKHVAAGEADPQSSKTKKLAKKSLKAMRDYDKANRDVKYGESLMWKLIAEANKNGYSVNSSYVTRMSSKGQKILTSMGAIGALPAAALYSVDKRRYGSDAGAGYVHGAKYDVHKTKPGETAEVRLNIYR